MLKKITLALFIAISSATTFVSCSSNDDNTEQQQNSQYNINPPKWLHGKWNSINFDDYYIFSSNDIEDQDFSWREQFEAYLKIVNPNDNKIRFYDKNISSTYYEAESTDVNGVLLDNLKVEKLSNTSVKITYTVHYDDGNDIIVETYNKE